MIEPSIVNEASYSPHERAKELLEYVSNYSRQKRFEAIGAKPPSKETEPFEHILYASQAFLSGALPEAETLCFVALSLDKYIRGEGKLSLDEAFGLKSKPKIGNPAKQYAHKNSINGRLFEMAWLRATEEISIEQAALRVWDELDSTDAGTLTRQYSRGKWSEVEKKILVGNLKP